MTASRQRWAATLLGTLGCLVALACAQRLAARTGWRVDLTPEQRAVLSDHARGILASLTEPVALTAFLRADDPRNREIEDLLARVAAAQPLVRYRVLDLNRNPALARELGIDAYGALVVESGGRRRDFANPDEPTLMAAIIQVTRPDRPRVYVTAGNGERRLADRDRRNGFSSANIALINERYDVGELRLDADTPVPADAAAVIVPGPERDLSPAALRQLDAYLRRGGGVVVLLDPGQAPALAAQLQRYGIVASDEVVLDPERRLFAGDLLTMLVPGHDPSHPISANLSAAPLLSALRPVRGAGGAGAALLTTSPASWRTPDRDPLTTGAGTFVAERDTRGPVAVAAAAQVPAADRAGRLVVVGDADFASNLLLDYAGNRDLFLNAVDWVAGEDTLIGSRPLRQLPGVNQLFVSAAQGETIFWLGAVAQPMAALLLGLVVVGRRRRSG
ncbi:MAG: GldG family protein [Candidatus Binatia bacterium]